MSLINKFRTSDGINIKYAIDDFSPLWKSPSTVVMLHAAMGSMERFRAWVPAISEKFRVVRWDMRGHGDSDEPDEQAELSIRRLSRDLVEMLDHLKLENAQVVGSSTGGIIAMHAAINYPDRIRSVASYAAIPGLKPSTNHNDYDDWDRGLVKEGVSNFMRRTISQRFHIDQVEPGFVDWFIQNSARNNPLFLARFVKMMTTFDFSDELQQIQCPLLAVVPSGDPVHSMENYEVVKRVPNHRFVVFDNMPHNITDAVPHRCVAELLPFLEAM